MIIKECSEHQLGEILEIFNWAIANTTALYDYAPRSPQAISEWYALRKNRQIPVIGCFDDNNKLLGFATYGDFRHYEGYKFTVEHSVYVHPDYHQSGIGEILLQRLIAQAKNNNIHTLVGVIDADNEASIRLHAKLGFVYCG
ncbi:MAG: GNAT family N-acetyltransferase, partial [Paludibacter sp.]|nr:GNAT family N-acetyltransferase [Paludibacter sp.]